MSDAFAPSPTQPPLLGARPGSAAPIDGDTWVWSSTDGRTSVALRAPLVRAIEACATFQTRDEHVARIAAALGAPAPIASAQLDALVASGIVVEPAWFVPRDAGASTPIPEPLIAIRTFRRPEGLRRLLASLLDDERRCGARRRYVVIDDEPLASEEHRARDIVAAFARESRSEAHYFGESARAALLPGLLADLDEAQREAAMQLLSRHLPVRPTGARVWNWAVLLAAGGALSILDDDLAFPVRRYAQSDDGIDLRDTIGSQIRVFDDIAQIDEPVYAGDPFEYARAFCGERSATLIARHGWAGTELHGRDVSQISFLKPGSRVLAAFTGVYGAYAWDTTVHFATSKRDNLEDFWREPYRHERMNGDVVTYGVLRPRLTSHASYTPFLIDARDLLPFAGTWDKGDDASFLGALAAIDPNTNYCYLPLLNGHFPVERRERLRQSLEPLLHDVNAFVADHVQWYAAGLRSTDRRARFAAIAGGCADLAAADDAAITDAVTRWRHANLGYCVARHREALAIGTHAPPQWRAYVQRMLEVNSVAMARDCFEQRPLAQHRAALAQLATGASAWPMLWDRFVSDPGTLVRCAPALPR